jgi:lipoprotein-releasing system permease protein
MKFELFVALRYLKAKRKQTMVSVISFISVLGITAGVTALVIALALSSGFREDIQTKIVGATSYINLQRIDGSAFVDYGDLIARLGRAPHVTGVAPAIFAQVYILSPTHNQGAQLKGIDPALERHISDFFSHVVEGDPLALDARPTPVSADPEAPPPPGNVIIGKEMARALGVRIGDTMRIVFPREV